MDPWISIDHPGTGSQCARHRLSVCTRCRCELRCELRTVVYRRIVDQLPLTILNHSFQQMECSHVHELHPGFPTIAVVDPAVVMNV